LARWTPTPLASLAAVKHQTGQTTVALYSLLSHLRLAHACRLLSLAVHRSRLGAGRRRRGQVDETESRLRGRSQFHTTGFWLPIVRLAVGRGRAGGLLLLLFLVPHQWERTYVARVRLTVRHCPTGPDDCAISKPEAGPRTRQPGRAKGSTAPMGTSDDEYAAQGRAS
jgi:hypothetical protein